MKKGGYFFAICCFLIPQNAAEWYQFERKCEIVPTVFITQMIITYIQSSESHDQNPKSISIPTFRSTYMKEATKAL